MQTRLRRLTIALAVTAAVMTGCGDGDNGPEVLRDYDVELRVDDSQDDYRYVFVSTDLDGVDEGEIPDFTVGDEVTFRVDNTGQFPHDLQVLAPDGDVAGAADVVVSGEQLELTVFLGQTGIYRLNCLFDNHLTEHDMQTLIEVRPAQL